MAAGWPLGVDVCKEFQEIKPAARWGLLDKGLDVGVLLAEGLDIPADWGEFNVGEGVVQRVGARRGSPSGCGRGPKDPKCEQVMGEDDFGGLARVVAVCF